MFDRLNFIESGLRDSDPSADGDQDRWIETILFFLPQITKELNGVLEDLAKKFDIKEEVFNG